MARESVTRLLWSSGGIVLLCVATGIVRTLREFVFPTYSGFQFYQPLFAIPLHLVFSFIGLGVAQLVAFQSRLAPIQSWSGNILFGMSCSAATLAALLAEKHLPQWLASPGSVHMLVTLCALALVLCVATRLAASAWSSRGHT